MQKKTKATTTKTTTKMGDDAKSAKKLYADTLKAIDKRVDQLDEKVKNMMGIYPPIDTATHASSPCDHIPAAQKLAETGLIPASNLILSMADASHTDLDTHAKMCEEPFDASGKTFTNLNQLLLGLIEKRAVPGKRGGVSLPTVKHRWTHKDADVNPFKTGRPNKQHWNQIYAQKLEWEKERRAERRLRREDVEDCVAVTFSDLKEETDYLARYDLELASPEFLPS